MSLKDRLLEDWKTSMKKRDSFRANILNMARAAILQAEKNNNTTIDDNEIIDVISKEIKLRRDALVEFEKGNRQDLVDKNNQEIEILLEYLPQQLTEQEIYEIVEGAVKEVNATNPKDMGKVMAVVTPKTKGRADGKLVSHIVKTILSNS